jgi:RNA polymerase sigma factor (sigma-70 family)
VPDPRSTAELVEAAAVGDDGAWNELVARYAALVVSVCRRFHLTEADSHDVSQNVWLQLVERLDSLREPAALPGWLVTTTRHECMRLRRQSSVRPMLGEPWDDVSNDDDLLGDLLAAERRAALREALGALPASWRRLVELLVVDPPLSYAEISERLGVPLGSIGPTRARILRKLRGTPAIASLLRDESCAGPSGPMRAPTSTRGNHEW